MGKRSSAETSETIKRLLQEDANVRVDAARLDELRRVLADEMLQIASYSNSLNATTTTATSTTKITSSIHAQWLTFVRSSQAELVRQLCYRIQKQEMGQQVSACRTLMGVMAHSPATAACITNNFNSSSSSRLGHHSLATSYNLVDCGLLQKMVRALVVADEIDLQHDKQLRIVLESEFLGRYRDVQYYGMLVIATVAKNLHCAIKIKKKSDRKGMQELKGNEKDVHCTTTTTEKYIMNGDVAQRLSDLLQMIPLASTQRDLDQASTITGHGGAFLFPPRKDVTPENDEDSDDGAADEDEVDDDSLESGLESSDENKSKEIRPSKRPKIESKSSFACASVRRHRSVWTKAWLAVLRLPMKESVLKQVLRYLPTEVLSVSTCPLRFADFFMQAYSANNSSMMVPMLALEGLFLLMTQHGLEYHDFYKQLYKLILSPSLLFVKYRAKFCRLLDKSLSHNEMLPAHIVAAFVKRLMRSALSAPPASCIFVMALCSNLLRRHPETMCLIHRQKSDTKPIQNEDRYTDDVINEECLHDGFDANVEDPEEANALQSSLWELGALEKHYHPAVASLAKSIGRIDELHTPLHNLEEFIGLTYITLFEQERNKRKKSKTPLTFHRPESLFPENDVLAGILSLPK